MTSGQMWNHIRGPPVMHKNPQTGQIVSVFIGLIDIAVLVIGHLLYIFPLTAPKDIFSIHGLRLINILKIISQCDFKCIMT